MSSGIGFLNIIFAMYFSLSNSRFGRFIDSHTIGKDSEDDTIEKMISENIGTLVFQ